MGKVERLLAEGRMRPAGLAEVEAAQADGRWDAAYESQRTAEVPDDLTAALAADDAARAAFEALGRSERYAVMLPVLKADHVRRPVPARSPGPSPGSARADPDHLEVVLRHHPNWAFGR